MMAIRFYSSLFWLLAVTSVAYGQRVSVHHYIAKKGAFVARLTTRIGGLPDGDMTGWWGATSKTADIPEALIVTYKGKCITMPRSAFSDLLNVYRLSISVFGERCTIRLEGSDASEAFVAKITLIRNRVTRRIVQSNEDPHCYEVTSYHE